MQSFKGKSQIYINEANSTFFKSSSRLTWMGLFAIITLAYLRFFAGEKFSAQYLILELLIFITSLILFWLSTTFLENSKDSPKKWLSIILIIRFLHISFIAIYLNIHLTKYGIGGWIGLVVIGITTWGIESISIANYLIPLFNYLLLVTLIMPSLFFAIYFEKISSYAPALIFSFYLALKIIQSKVRLNNFSKRINIQEELNENVRNKEQIKEENYELLQKIDIITSASNFGFFFEDLEKKTLIASKKLMSISNLPNLKDPEEADRIFAERIHPAFRDDVLKKMQLFYNGKIELLTENFKFYRTPTEIIWLNLYLMAEKRNELTNMPIKVIGYHQDITTQKEIELKLTQSAKLESIGLMASGIAHEINNPLTIISIANQRIKKNNDKEIEREIIQTEITKDTKKIDDTIKRIATIIQGLTSFSRNSSADPFEPVIIENLIEDIKNFTQNRLTFSDTKLLIEGDISNKEIVCQKIALSQVLINLINNSIDAIESRDDKWVMLKFIFEENAMNIKIIDSGEGISQNIQENMMSPFFTTKEVGKGTGLGLSICSTIIKNHNGKLSLEPNTINTTFSIELPFKSKQL